MRHALVVALLAAWVCAGCEKPKGPQTTEPQPPVEHAGKLKPLEPPEAVPAEPPVAVADVMPPAGLAPSAPEVTVTAEPPEPAPAASTYVVQKGDTLWRIATRFYGNGQRYRDIQAANPGLVANRLRIGQKLALPPK
jgi:5'-nucleotidase/UDP-sugar diphosphatase